MTTVLSVLLCGGPGDGQRVDVASSRTHYVHATEEPMMSFRIGEPLRFVRPEYTRTTYRITVAQAPTGPTWVGVVWDASPEQQESDAQRALTMETMRQVRNQRTLTQEESVMTRFMPATKAEIIERIRQSTGLSGSSASAVYDMISAHVKGVEPMAPDDGLEHMTIKTSNPDKWRFFDTETGETWRWDVEKKAFVKVTYPS